MSVLLEIVAEGDEIIFEVEKTLSKVVENIFERVRRGVQRAFPGA